ncbi:hypothetical protein C8F01DRAFT_1352772 [Mycena amicta]|nr:hypothetical protein C8F01DRAFT_1352772 [Mycena amicta]
MKVTIKHWHAVAQWRWDMGTDHNVSEEDDVLATTARSSGPMFRVARLPHAFVSPSGSAQHADVEAAASYGSKGVGSTPSRPSRSQSRVPSTLRYQFLYPGSVRAPDRHVATVQFSSHIDAGLKSYQSRRTDKLRRGGIVLIQCQLMDALCDGRCFPLVVRAGNDPSVDNTYRGTSHLAWSMQGPPYSPLMCFGEFTTTNSAGQRVLLGPRADS